MTYVSTARIPEATDPEFIVDALEGVYDGGNNGGGGGNDPIPPVPSPAGFVIIAEIRPEVESTLRGVAKELQRRRLFPRTILIGIDHHRGTLETMLDVYETTIIVDPGNEELIDDLLEFLPALFDNWEALGTCGSVQLPKIDVSGVDPRGVSADTERELRVRKTPVLHQLAEVDYPDFYAVSAPGDYVSLAVNVLGQQADVVDVQGANESTISVAGFVFDELGQDIDDRLEALQRDRQPNHEGGSRDVDPEPRAGNGGGDIDRDIDSVVYREYSGR
jgi:hypothetical protein